MHRLCQGLDLGGGRLRPPSRWKASQSSGWGGQVNARTSDCAYFRALFRNLESEPQKGQRTCLKLHKLSVIKGVKRLARELNFWKRIEKEIQSALSGGNSTSVSLRDC